MEKSSLENTIKVSKDCIPRRYFYGLESKIFKTDVEFRPEVRWWLAEGFHTDQTLKNDIRMIYDSGFGAVEFLAMDEPGADSSLYGWGSEEWVHDSHTVMREATDRNMGVSMTSGTNWSNANLITITPDDKAAAKELDFTSQVLEPGERRTGASGNVCSHQTQCPLPGTSGCGCCQKDIPQRRRTGNSVSCGRDIPPADPSG